MDQKEHEQIFPKPGWVEHDPKEIWTRSQEVIDGALKKAGHRRERPGRRRHHEPARDDGRLGPQHGRARLQRARVAGHAPAGHRRLARRTAGRTGSVRRPVFRSPRTSRAPRSAGSSTTWTARAREAEAGDLVFGNIDTWCIWNLTGGTDGGVHVTDVTNASRTMLMNLETLDWDDDLCSAIGVPQVDAAADPVVVARCTARRRARSQASRSRATWATSRRPRSGRPPTTSATRRTRTAPATS